MFTYLSSPAQVHIPAKAFYQHLQTCHYIGTTEDDFVIVLNSDSTINLITYETDYQDEYNTMMKQTYSGTYSMFEDTITAKFTEHNSLLKNKNKEITGTTVIKKTDSLFNTHTVVQYPPTRFIINRNTLITVDESFPDLNISTVTSVMLLESKFLNWDKNSLIHNKKS